MRLLVLTICLLVAIAAISATPARWQRWGKRQQLGSPESHESNESKPAAGARRQRPASLESHESNESKPAAGARRQQRPASPESHESNESKPDVRFLRAMRAFKARTHAKPGKQQTRSRTTKRDGTCAGFCYGAGSDGFCYCDAMCEELGDCCFDFHDVCDITGSGFPPPPPGSGNPPPPPGSGNPPPPPGSGAGTCVGHCDDIGSDYVCWCDDICEENMDCCADYAAVCPSTSASFETSWYPSSEWSWWSSFESSDTCDGNCGGFAGECWCDSECVQWGDCCDDKEDFCA